MSAFGIIDNTIIFEELMGRNGIYYLGRINKHGLITHEDIEKALLNTSTVQIGKYLWTFLEIQKQQYNGSTYISGKLVKFDPQAVIKKVDESAKKEIIQYEPNLSLASSSFVYIPNHSGIAFLHVSNQIEYKTFIKAWAKVINSSVERLLSSCEIETISDLRTFANKISSLDGIHKIKAKVSPPNPMFGYLWKDLKQYLESRNTEQLKLEEEGKYKDNIKTELASYVKKMINNENNILKIDTPLPIVDAAILMAVDGYGVGYIEGTKSGEYIIIKTTDTVRNFTFNKDPEMEELYKKALSILEKIIHERHMEH